MLDAPAYLLGFATLLGSLWGLGMGAARVRSRLLVGWSGLPARLADSVITIALLLLIAELIGIVGALERVPLVLACVGVGLGLRTAIRPPAGDVQGPPAPDQGGWAMPVAVAISAILVLHWSIGTVNALGAGITNYDSTWYHMPFAAHFAQTGSSLGFAAVSPRYLAWFYPQNSELLHGIGMVFFKRDLLSPLLNLIWMGGCLAAAWCIGRPYGRGVWTLAGAAVVLDAGLMFDQAGEARNDALGLFFLLAAAAILVNGAAAAGWRRPGIGPVAVAGLAAGLAAGTKLSFLAPAAALLVAAPAFSASGQRRRAALAFAGPLLAGCAFWYIRNIAEAGNPLPWFKAVGPLRLDGPEQGLGGRPQFSVLHYIGDGKVWNDWFEPVLSHKLGELWPLLLLTVVGATVVCLLKAKPHLKMIACAAAAGLVVYLLDGTSAEGQPGTPDGFGSSLRHLTPALILALVLVSLLPGRWTRHRQLGVGALLAALLVSSDDSWSWQSPYGWLAFVAVVAAMTLPLLRSRELPPLMLRARGIARRMTPPATAAAAIALLLLGGWFLQRSYLSHRYSGDGFRSAGLDEVFKWASEQEGQRIGTTVPVQYPLSGSDLSNHVSFIGRQRNDGGFTAVKGCRELRSAVAAGHFRYVLTAGGTEPWEDGDSHCLAADPRARPLIHVNQVVVFSLRRPAPSLGGGQQEVRGGPAQVRSSDTRGDVSEHQRGSRS